MALEISTKEFLSAFHSEKETVFIRRFHDKDKENNPAENMAIPFSKFENIIPTLEKFNQNDYGIFFVVNSGGQSNKDVKQAKAQFMEVDDLTIEEQAQKINSFPLPPSIIVKTRKSLHAYWLLSNGDIKKFRNIQERLIQYFGSDSAIKNESRVMRLPNFYHNKKEPLMVEIIKFDKDLRYTQEQLAEYLPEVVQGATKQFNSNQEGNNLFSEGRRNSDLTSIAGTLQKKGIPDNLILKTLEELNNTACPHPLNKNELEQICDSVVKRYSKGTPTITKCEKGVFKQVTKEVALPKIINAEWLGKQELMPVEFIVENLLPIGLNILASPPKHGKSFMALDLCLSVASGTSFLGMKVQQSKVFYMALEDSENRLQTRMKQILGNMSFPANLNITTNINDLSNGFIQQLEMVLEEHPQTKLFVIDTLQFIRGTFNRNEGAYSHDYKEMAEIKKFADAHKVCVLVIHHSRKDTNPADAFANISGTNGITGAMDCMLVLSKEERMSKQTKMSVCGRDVEQGEYILEMTNGKWRLIGSAEEELERQTKKAYNQNNLVLTIRELVRQNQTEGWIGTISDLLTSSQYFKTPIYGDIRIIGKNISSLDDELYNNDFIIHDTIKNGNGAKKHRFALAKTPFE